MKDRLIGTWTAALVAVISLFACGVAQADINAASLAVPAIGTSGPASLYPSTIDVTAPQGPNHRAHVTVQLTGVTDPCPRELAVLLVHNGVDAYPLMHNAGGCQPMQGTILILDEREQNVIPENPSPTAPPYGPLHYAKPTRYGAMPTFPAPAPQGARYHPTVPDLVTVNGTWSLYVIDTGGSGRGVIAGGWALMFHHSVQSFQETVIDVPGGNPPGAARQYPIVFDLSSVHPGLRIDPSRLSVELHIEHERPRDLQILLESPTRERVVLMANAGGSTRVDRALVFADFDNVPSVPFDAPITERVYRPGSAYGTVLLPPPAPDLPYERSFNAVNGIPLAGLWKLWVFDSVPQSANGRIKKAAMYYFAGEDLPRVTLAASTPAAATANQPFVRVEAHTERVVTTDRPAGVVLWRVINGGTFYAAGTFDITPGTGDITADVPVKKGENRIDIIPVNGFDEPMSTGITRTVREFTYALAEGATGEFFDLDVTLANAGNMAAPIAIDFLPEGGAPILTTNTVPANAPLQIRADLVTDRGATSTVVHSTEAVPLAIERTMSWDARGYGGHGSGAASPARRWLFAEGSQGFFHTYVMLANDHANDVAVRVKFLVEGGGVVTHDVTVPARSRQTIDAGTLPAVVGRSFGLDITAEAPIIAERAMYFSMGTDRLFDGGHESAGVNETSTRWFLAEGATGPFFDCFVLLSNPNDAPARVRLTYLLPDGATYAQDVRMAPNSRETINVETVAPLLANAAVSTMVIADVGIVVERAMYWPNVAVGWREAHNSFGVTQTGLRWGLADGRLGGPRGYETYILLANPNAHAAEVQLRFLQSGAEVTRLYTLPPTSRLSISASEIEELRDGVFGAEIQVLNAQPIAVEKALYWNADGEIWAAGTNVTATRLPPR
jgi:Proprotein convertase P-domain